MSHLHLIFFYKAKVDLENHSGQNILSMREGFHEQTFWMLRMLLFVLWFQD